MRIVVQVPALQNDSGVSVSAIAFDRSTVRFGGPFTANTYFDVGFSRPGSSIDEVDLDWQQGPLAPHAVASGINNALSGPGRFDHPTLILQN